MDYLPLLPPGAWRSREAEAQWDAILEWRESVTSSYRQQLYRAMTDARFASRMANPDYRTRFERKHKADCDRIDAAAMSHMKENYVPTSGPWDPDFQLQWVPSDEAPFR
jgi:hypothetical protein